MSNSKHSVNIIPLYQTSDVYLYCYLTTYTTLKQPLWKLQDADLFPQRRLLPSA